MGAIRNLVGPRRRSTLKVGAAVLAVGLAVAIGTSGTPAGLAATVPTKPAGTAHFGRSSTPADAQRVKGCDTLPDDITAGADVDPELVVKCDEREFGLSEGQRHAASSGAQKAEVRTSSICVPVNARAATGDSTLDFGLAFHCRQQEQFADEINGANGIAAPQLSSLCTGADLRQQGGEKVDKFTQALCAGEQAALGGGAAGGAVRQRATR